jgi:hypothetical protein
MPMRRKISIIVASVVALLAVVSFSPNCAAAPKLIVYDVQVSADPSIQGPDLPIKLNAKAGSGGACCYVVYGQNLKAELLLPEGWTLVDGAKVQDLTSPGQAVGTVAAQPGGGLTWNDINWYISGPKLGKYEVAVRVTGTNDAGDRLNVSGFTNITIASGAAISSPILPQRPVVGKETVMLASVSSRSGVKSVTLYLSMDNVNWKAVPMTLISGDQYKAVLPKADKETTYKVFMQSIDGKDEPFNTTVYEIPVKDPGRITGISQSGAVFVTLGSLIGMVLVLYVGGRTVSAFRSKGIFLVGDYRMEAALRERDEMKAAQKRMTAMRWKLLAALVVVVVVLFLVSLLTGQLDKVVKHTTNTQEALIWARM